MEEKQAETAPPTGRQAAWNYLVFGLSKSATLIMTIVAARLLVPADFGIFALALLVVNLFDYMKDLGVGAAIVQRSGDWNRLAPTGLTLSVIFGVVFGLTLAVAAPLGAAILHEPRLTPLIRVLAIGLTISALGVIPAARLRRDLAFQKRIWPEFLGAVVKAAVTIGLAVAGVGVWSLIYGQLAGTVVMTVLYWVVARSPIVFGFDKHEAKGLIRFGISLTAVALLSFAMFNLDYLSIGVRLGDTQLGLYTLAYRLPELLVLNLCIVISEVLFSSLSKLQHDREMLAEHYLQVTKAAVALSAPISVILATAAPAVIRTMYGDQYADAAPVLAILSIYTLVYSTSWHAGDVFKAMGRPSLLIVISSVKVVLMIVPVWFAAGHSIVMVALVLLAIEILPFIANMVLVKRIAGTTWSALAGSVTRALPAAAFMAVVMLGLGHLVRGLPAPLVLAITGTAGLIAYGAAMRVTGPELFAAGLSAVKSVRGRGAASA